ncbi:hypothetical protein OB13_15225 [Pontibacter sp. HJ8]
MRNRLFIMVQIRYKGHALRALATPNYRDDQGSETLQHLLFPLAASRAHTATAVVKSLFL